MNNQSGNSSSRRGQKSGKIVPATLKGMQISVNTGDIPSGQWKHCHGIAQSTGQQVNSLKIAQVGESTVIQADSGFASSFDSNELEVAAIAFLNQRGYITNYNGKNN